MKLNIDCVKDVLLEIEQENVFVDGKLVKLSHNAIANSKRCAKYNMDDIRYTIYHLMHAGFIEGSLVPDEEGFRISWIDRITPSGHEFISNIRNETVFSKLKDVLKSVGVFSIASAAEIAKEYAINLARQKLGI